jgi:HSP20 family protein
LDDIDQDKIDASFKNGILNVTLPKSPTAQHRERYRNARFERRPP